MITMHVDMRVLVPRLKRMDGATKSVARKAGSTAIRDMRATANKSVRERKGIKSTHVGKALFLVYPATGKDKLLWKVGAKNAGMPVFAYKSVRQTKKGVSVAINEGSRVTIAHAFKATMKSGHEGIFMRYGEARKMPIQSYRGHRRYAGQRRQPIRELYTSRVSDAFKDSAPIIAARGRASFLATFERLIPIELSKRGA